MGDADAVDLLGQDVIDALLEVGDLVFEPVGQAARDLAEEDTGLGDTGRGT